MSTDLPANATTMPEGRRIWTYRARSLLRRFCWRFSDRLRAAPPHGGSILPLPAVPLRVGFVVCEQAKWGLGSVLAELKATPGVTVGFYPTLSDVSLRMKSSDRRSDFATQVDFFAKLGPIWAELYDADTDRMLPEDVIDCDLVFIQQPWGMQDLPRRLSGRVRTAYVHYGMAVISNDRMQFGLPDFHPWLWRYYMPTDLHAKAVFTASSFRQPDIRVTGHPKFDTYLAPPPARDMVRTWPHTLDPKRKRVIFAPHHGLEKGSLGLGTFAWSGPVMLDLARRHSSVDFVLRPHPNMAVGLARSGLMQAADWQTYKSQWSALPNASVLEASPYWDLFRTSDVMITDSGSFLAEYLPTGNPLIRLEQDGAAPLNAFGQKLSGGFYRVANTAELEAMFTQIALAENDPLAEARSALAALLTPLDQPAAKIITQDILNSYVQD
ncbi:hypothetical protein [Tritonibacter scottomollicae]|uniref:CDP-glycerol:poly(Glycerophosphate) glycerophosphotransferase n=1 Tax=Tritonibacter scottomollicae TaxID=483013 RepID=A0A2T1A5J6_TRISK|nr:hypothetical protein [Tritonibacter scottomollicae]PRZ43860.1 hypothetical protein CLV89_1256 [Tritonibacter scottomollicae]